MDLQQAVRIRRRACRRKTRMSLSTAARVSGRHPQMTKYRCPFCGSWHVAHVTSLSGLQDVADAIRILAQQEQL